MSLLAVLTAVTLVATLTSAKADASEEDYCQRAYDKCAFRFGFTKKIQTFALPDNATLPFTPRLRSKKFGQLLGIANTNGKTPEFVFKGGAYPVSNFGDPYYTPTHFKPVAMGMGGSGIAHEEFTGDQFEFARFRCVRVFFTSFQVLDGEGNVKRVENNVPFSKSKCVVFRTK